MGCAGSRRSSGWCELKPLGDRKKLDFDSRGWGFMRMTFGFAQTTGSCRRYFKESIKKKISVTLQELGPQSFSQPA